MNNTCSYCHRYSSSFLGIERQLAAWRMSSARNRNTLFSLFVCVLYNLSFVPCPFRVPGIFFVRRCRKDFRRCYFFCPVADFFSKKIIACKQTSMYFECLTCNSIRKWNLPQIKAEKHTSTLTWHLTILFCWYTMHNWP